MVRPPQKKPFADLLNRQSQRGSGRDHLSSLERKYNIDRAQLDKAIDTVEYGSMLSHSEQMGRHRDRMRADAEERRKRKHCHQGEVLTRALAKSEESIRMRSQWDDALFVRQTVSQYSRCRRHEELAAHARDVNAAKRREVKNSRKQFDEQGQTARDVVMRRLGFQMPISRVPDGASPPLPEPRGPQPRGLPPARPYRRFKLQEASPRSAAPSAGGGPLLLRQSPSGAAEAAPAGGSPTSAAAARSADPQSPASASTGAPRTGRLTRQAVEAASQWLRWKAEDDRRRQAQQHALP